MRDHLPTERISKRKFGSRSRRRMSAVLKTIVSPDPRGCPGHPLQIGLFMEPDRVFAQVKDDGFRLAVQSSAAGPASTWSTTSSTVADGLDFEVAAAPCEAAF